MGNQELVQSTQQPVIKHCTWYTVDKESSGSKGVNVLAATPVINFQYQLGLKLLWTSMIWSYGTRVKELISVCMKSALGAQWHPILSLGVRWKWYAGLVERACAQQHSS